MKKILGLLLVSSSIFSMQLDIVKVDTKVNRFQEKLLKHNNFDINTVSKVRIEPASVFVPNKLGLVELYHSPKGFYVHHNDKIKRIQKCFVDPMVRNITPEQLQSFDKVGYFHINQMSDGEYSLKAKPRLVGGGPIFGSFMYWLTKSTLYGIAGAAVGGAIITGGGTIVATVTGGAAVGGTAATGGAIIGSAVTGGTAIGGTAATTGSFIVGAASTAATGTVIGAATTTAGVIGTTAGLVVTGTGTAGAVVGGAGIIAGGIMNAGLAGEAVVVTTGVITSISANGVTAGTIATAVVAVETVSVAVGTFFGMVPIIP